MSQLLPETVIKALQGLRAELQERIQSIDTLLALESRQDASPGASVGNSRRRAARPSRQPIKPAEPSQSDSDLGATDMVRESCKHLQAPFSRVEVLDYLGRRWPERMEEMKPAAVDGVLARMRKTGELVVCGERPGLKGPLTLHKLGTITR